MINDKCALTSQWDPQPTSYANSKKSQIPSQFFRPKLLISIASQMQITLPGIGGD